MPLEKGHLTHWVRFQGKTYPPPGQAVKAVVPERSDYCYEDWVRALTACHDACLGKGGQGKLQIGDKATDKQIRSIESKLGWRLPESLRIYLSMDGIMHGWRLGYDFASFMQHWIHVGCAGHWGQDFMLLPSSSAPYVDHTSDNALLVKQWLGMKRNKEEK